MRSVSLLVVLLVAAPSLSAATRTGDSADNGHPLFVMDADDILLPRETGWRITHASHPLGLRAMGGPDLRMEDLRVPLLGAEVFAFEARILGAGRLHVLVDGVAVAEVRTGASEAMDLALGGDEQILTLRFEPAGPQSVVDLVLYGARPIHSPVAVGVPREMVACVPPDVRFVLRWASPLPDAALEALVDGVPAKSKVESRRVGLVWEHQVSVALPPRGEGRHDLTLALSATDPTGRVWELPPMALRLLVDLMAQTYPQEWAYELRPTVALSIPCLIHHVASYEILVDGKDVTNAAQKRLTGFVWQFPEPLAYEEEHTYAFHITLNDGTSHAFEGRFREGLDVVEFELTEGRVVWEPTPAATSLRNDLAPEQLPPMAVLGALGKEQLVVDAFSGAHLRAVYAPRAMACTPVETGQLCLPHGGNAPGYAYGMPEATLEITPHHTGMTHVIPAAGQLAAASYHSRVWAPELSLVVPEAP